ncbi:LysR family transcriptional regulator [Pseudaquidulcibacter saccharophilus]|uniref:LysR family transcriptional regulator n=1 Tax=Pseudaquidulcibacter saccharophilus TaxID=2831900 RepID=UPI001EFF1F29|nr:LysR family transcriptional regulator [Pseudaquidulcibacter saccharophilus]
MDKLNLAPDVTIDKMKTYVRIVERGNLSAVAREFKTGQATISRHLQDIEKALGVSLLSRNTRNLTITNEGMIYYHRCLQILKLLEQANEEVGLKKHANSGKIRFSCSVAIGVAHITEMILKFQEFYPDIEIDINFTDEKINLIEEGVDFSIRIGGIVDSSLKLKPIGKSQRLLVASPEYINKFGLPKTINDLQNHQFASMSNLLNYNILQITNPEGKTHEIGIKGNISIDNGLAARKIIENGRSIGISHIWLIDDLLKQNKLIQILPEYKVSPVEINMLIVPERNNLKRVRALIDFLYSEILKLPGIYKK